VAAGAVAGVLSGAPSTVLSLVRRGNLLDSTAAAGTILMPDDASRPVLLAMGAVNHAALSLSWGVVLATVMRRRPSVVTGALAGLGIAALDLGVIGRRFARIGALDPVPQVLDHIAFGVVVAAVLRRRRALV
jgi:hypothetical protein